MGLALARCCRDDFSDRELRDYLDHLKSGIEGGCEGDNKARAVVNGNLHSPSKFPLEDIHVQRLIEELLDGPTGGEDEDAILELLKQSKPDRLQVLFTTGGLTAKGLLSDFSGRQETDLRAFFEQRFEGGLKALEAGDVRPIPEATPVEEVPWAPVEGESRGFRLEDLKRLRERKAKLTFTGDLSPLGAKAQQVLLDNIAATVSFALDPENPDRVQEVKKLRQSFEKEQMTRSPTYQQSYAFFENPAERLDARDFYHGHVSVPKAVMASHPRLKELKNEVSTYHHYGPNPSIDSKLKTLIDKDKQAPTSQLQAREVMKKVKEHKAAFLKALDQLMEALKDVPEAGVEYHTWEVDKPKVGSVTMTPGNPIRKIFTLFSKPKPVSGPRDLDTLIDFSFHVNRRGEITLLPGSSQIGIRAFEILYGWDEAPDAAKTPAKPKLDPTAPPGGKP